MLREVGLLNTRSKDSLLKVVLKAPALPAIFLLFPRTRFPALPSAPFGEELPGPIGHLLPEEREPLKTACLPKQMRHKNDRAVLTRLPHPVRHNRSACFITEFFELELPKSDNTHRARSTHVVSNARVCVCVCVLAFVCVCAFAFVAYWYASVDHNPRIHVHPPRVRATLCAFIKLWCITCIALSFVNALAGPKKSIMACDIRESIPWVRFALLFADISFASSLLLVVFESDASKPDSNSQFVFMLHRNNHKNNSHTRSPPIDSDVSKVDLKFH